MTLFVKQKFLPRSPRQYNSRVQMKSCSYKFNLVATGFSIVTYKFESGFVLSVSPNVGELKYYPYITEGFFITFLYISLDLCNSKYLQR